MADLWKLFHKELGVEVGASQTVIRNAYRKIALKNHPDKNGGNPEATERFKRASAAFEVLSGKRPYNPDAYQPGSAKPRTSNQSGNYTNPPEFNEEEFWAHINDLFGHNKPKRTNKKNFSTTTRKRFGLMGPYDEIDTPEQWGMGGLEEPYRTLSTKKDGDLYKSLRAEESAKLRVQAAGAIEGLEKEYPKLDAAIQKTNAFINTEYDKSNDFDEVYNFVEQAIGALTSWRRNFDYDTRKASDGLVHAEEDIRTLESWKDPRQNGVNAWKELQKDVLIAYPKEAENYLQQIKTSSPTGIQNLPFYKKLAEKGRFNVGFTEKGQAKTRVAENIKKIINAVEAAPYRTRSLDALLDESLAKTVLHKVNDKAQALRKTIAPDYITIDRSKISHDVWVQTNTLTSRRENFFCLYNFEQMKTALGKASEHIPPLTYSTLVALCDTAITKEPQSVSIAKETTRSLQKGEDIFQKDATLSSLRKQSDQHKERAAKAEKDLAALGAKETLHDLVHLVHVADGYAPTTFSGTYDKTFKIDVAVERMKSFSDTVEKTEALAQKIKGKSVTPKAKKCAQKFSL